MDDIYQKIELQFSNDISDLDSKFHKEGHARRQPRRSSKAHSGVF